MSRNWFNVKQRRHPSMLHLFAYIPVDVYIWTVYTDNT